MSTWLARLSNLKNPGTDATKATKPASDTYAGGSVGFVAHPSAPLEKPDEEFCRFRSLPAGELQKNDGAVAHTDATAANAPTTAPDRWAWPHSSAMNEQELGTFMARQDLLQQRGASPQEAERLADMLVNRDRSDDDRHICLECSHLRGMGPYRCGNARAAGMHPYLARDLALTLQRCHGYDRARLPIGVIFDAAPPSSASTSETAKNS